jgi:hypothetical protein
MGVAAGVLLCRGLSWRQPWNVAVTEAFATECEGELPEDADPPEVAIGERLFLETRFAQFFFANAKGNANAVLPAGDPVMDTTQTTGASLPGPFAGQSMNCRNCHFVDEHLGQEGLPGSVGRKEV